MSISVDGLVSGLDTTDIVSQLIELERRPIRLKEATQVSLVDQKLAWQEVSTRLLSLETAAKNIDTADEFNSNSAVFNNNSTTGGSVLSVTAGSSATEGSYAIKVTQLATAEKWASTDSISDNTAALNTTGTITINVDSTDYDITVASSDSLNDIKTAINTSGAGVTATVFNAGTSASPDYKLVMTGDSSGSAKAVTITEDVSLTFSNTQDAQDALFEIDGVSVTKDSNVVTDVISDVTLNLDTIGSGTITFSTDYDAIMDKVQAFADSYNEAMDYIKGQFAFNPDLDNKAALFGNGTLATIQNQLRSIVSAMVPGIDETDSDNLAAISQVGILTDELDHLVIDQDTFKDMLKDRLADVRNLFASSGSGTYTLVAADANTTGGTYNTRVNGGVLQLQLQGGDGTWLDMDTTAGYAYGQDDTDLEGLILEVGTLTESETGTVRVAIGIAERVGGNTAQYTEFSTNGLIFNQYKSIEDQDKELSDQIDDLEERIAKKEEDLKSKFVHLETLLAKLNSEQGYLDSQLASLSKSWK